MCGSPAQNESGQQLWPWVQASSEKVEGGMVQVVVAPALSVQVQVHAPLRLDRLRQLLAKQLECAEQVLHVEDVANLKTVAVDCDRKILQSGIKEVCQPSLIFADSSSAFFLLPTDQVVCALIT